jgi:hypothetical protein
MGDATTSSWTAGVTAAWSAAPSRSTSAVRAATSAVRMRICRGVGMGNRGSEGLLLSHDSYPQELCHYPHQDILLVVL